MAVPFSNTKLRVPHGFPNLLEGLSREVLRHQPKDIYGFAEKYFEELLKRREETGIDDLAQLGAKLNDRYYNNRAYCNPNLSSSNPEQQEAAVIIQSEYRRHRASREADALRDEQAAIQIQAAYRGYRDRQSLQLKITQTDALPKDTEEEELSTPSALPPSSGKPATPESKEDFHQSDPTTQGSSSADEPQTTSVPVTSSTQSLQSDQEPAADTQSHTQSTDSSTVRPTEENDEEQLRAAIIIQAQYRGYRVRKQYRVKVIAEEKEEEVPSFDPIAAEPNSSESGEHVTVTAITKSIEELVDDPESESVDREATKTPVEIPVVVDENQTSDPAALSETSDPVQQELQKQQKQEGEESSYDSKIPTEIEESGIADHPVEEENVTETQSADETQSLGEPKETTEIE